MSNGRISVIIPVYKVEKYLQQCVDSVINQTYKNLEIILVDDGSPDNCPQICDEYAKKDNRIKVIHKENGGLSDARNAGIDASCGEYIAFVDSDDYIAPEMYEVLYSLIKENDAAMSICERYEINEYGFPLPVSDIEIDEVITNSEALKRLQGGNSLYYISPCNKLYRCSMFDNCRFPKGKIHEDNAIMHRLIFSCDKICVTGKRLYYYRKRDGSITGRVTVNRLDDIFALFTRAGFYLDHGYSELVPAVTDIAYDNFVNIVVNLSFSNAKERIEARKRIKSLYKLYKKYAGNRSIKQSAVFRFTNLYLFLRKLNSIRKAIKIYINNLGCDYVLINTSTHGNLGEQAIALAEKQVLNDCRIKKINEITVEMFEFSGEIMDKIISPKQTVLIRGSGVMGSLRVFEEYRLRRIIEKFSRSKIIVLPQTVTFDTATEAGRRFFNESKKVYESHPDLTVFVCEKQSYDFMKEHMPCVKTLMVP